MTVVSTSKKDMPMREFPTGFKWGASTASYQIEGAVDEDGRGKSIWDTFSHTPGKIANGDTGDIACDHYHRYLEDIDLMARANMSVYRFSIAWPRVLPQGTGQVNAAGLDFYDRLIDALLDRGIEPWPCLYHWDLPQALQDRGGWENRDIADWFADYAEIAAARFRDRARHWVMFNEPQVTAHRGFAYGMYAPGFANRQKFFAATHHQNLAQGRALARLREIDPALRLGTVFNLSVPEPASASDEDRKAAQTYDLMWNRNFLDPLFKGKYPTESLPDLAGVLQDGDLAEIRHDVDFLGLNYYCRSFCKWDENHPLKVARAPAPSDRPRTCLDWEIHPPAFKQMLLRLRDEYGNPEVHITENGAAFNEPEAAETEIDDHERIAYLDGYLDAMREAIQEGANVQGYMIWSLIDNFEWSWGFGPRFGLVHMNYATLERTPKKSFHWFADVANRNALPADAKNGEK